MKLLLLTLVVLCLSLPGSASTPPATIQSSKSDAWITIPGGPGPGHGKTVVLIAADEEYRSEETLPQLARILAKRHGFNCIVLFGTDPKDGTVCPNVTNNSFVLPTVK